jgi:hypothetical protein
MAEQNPDETIEVARWKWNLFLDYIEAVEWLYVATAALHDRGAVQPELQSTFLRVEAVIQYLNQSVVEGQGSGENPESEAVTEQNYTEQLKVREAAYSTAAAYAGTVSRWCIYLSTGRTNYYGTSGGAVARCEKLAAPANISCVRVRKGRCP